MSGSRSKIRIESLSRDRRRRLSDTFDQDALAVLPAVQRTLLRQWLKNSAPTRRWHALLKLASPLPIEIAESLAQALVGCGAAVLEEHFAHSMWNPQILIWRDYESLCGALGLATRTTRRNLHSDAWTAAQPTAWRHDALQDAYLALRDESPDKARTRLSLLLKLNDWLHEGNSGTRRTFSLFARGHTKQITATEWAWLAGFVELEDCGIARHAPALWLAGDIQLKIGERWLDVGAAGDFIALTPASLARLSEGKTSAAHYRLIENRTSFENVVRKTPRDASEIVLWLPGYAPTWWRTAVGQLIGVLPLPARISCDADPDGVQIALSAAELWSAQSIAWEPHAMHADNAATSLHKLPLTERDSRLAETLLQIPGIPPALSALLQWCLDHRAKVEQENWL